MTQRLHDVLHDIAAEVPRTDLVAGVATRATRIKWARRATVGGTALAVAAVVGVVTVGLPSWQQGTSPDRDPVASQPTGPMLASTLDLDAAAHGVLPDPSGLAVVADADGASRLLALDVRAGEAVQLDTDVPAALESAWMTADGQRALLVGADQAVAVDLVSGETLQSVARTKHEPVALTWDGSALITFHKDEGSPADSTGTVRWQLVTIDVATAEVTELGEPLLRSSVAGDIFPAPSGDTIFIRYDGSLQDQRLHRVDLATGQTAFSEPYTALKTSAMFWRADGSMIVTETTSAIRLLSPTDEVGELVGSLRKVGVPLGFVGDDHLAWWRAGGTTSSVVLTDLEGTELPGTTSLTTGGTVLALAVSLG